MSQSIFDQSDRIAILTSERDQLQAKLDAAVKRIQRLEAEARTERFIVYECAFGERPILRIQVAENATKARETSERLTGLVQYIRVTDQHIELVDGHAP